MEVTLTIKDGDEITVHTGTAIAGVMYDENEQVAGQDLFTHAFTYGALSPKEELAVFSGLLACAKRRKDNLMNSLLGTEE